MPRPIPTVTGLDHLDDRTVLTQVRELSRRDSALLATLLAHLVLVDERKLYLGEGFGSCFDYCRAGLGWSESESWRRIQAARLCRRLPLVLAAIGEGRLHLSAACVLAPHLTDDNAGTLLAATAGLSKRDIEALVQGLAGRGSPTSAPLPGETSVATPPQSLFNFVEPPGAPDPDPVPTPVPATGGAVTRPPNTPTVPPASPSHRGAASAVGGPVRSPALTVRTTRALLTSLDKARALMAHVPGGTDTTVVLERALALLVETLEKARYGAKKRSPRAPRQEPTDPVPTDPSPVSAPTPLPVTPARASRRRAHIPARVRRAVYERDEGRCTFLGSSGHRCGSTFGVQLHHRLAWALDGTDDPDNLTIHCSVHNQYQADRDGLTRPSTRRNGRTKVKGPSGSRQSSWQPADRRVAPRRESPRRPTERPSN